MVRVIKGTSQDIDEIMNVTNEAFMADTFFKKPEYFLRFDRQTVETMISTENNYFLVAFLEEEPDIIVGSIFVHVDFEKDATGNITKVFGKFSAVSVLNKFEKRGIGRALVAGVESFIQETVNTLPNPTQIEKYIQMGVINKRKDLFPWYQKQGYEILYEIRPNDEEILRITREDMQDDICCVLMQKQLL